MKSGRNILIAFFLTIVVFVIDVTTAVGYADWIFYFVPLFVAAATLKKAFIAALPSIATALIIVGYFLAPAGGNITRTVSNRIMGICVIWWVSWIMMRQKQAEESLDRSYRELEQRVRERTEELRRANSLLREEVSERNRVEAEISSLSRKYELILEHAAEGILEINADGRTAFINQAGATMLGYTPDELVGTIPHAAWHYARPDGSPYPIDLCPIYRSFMDGTVHSGEDVFWKKDGTSFSGEFKSIPIREKDGITGAVLTFRDVTERRKMEEEIRQMAYQDALTGMPNRRLFLQVIPFEIAQSSRHRSKLAVLFLDLDRFKEINDTLGHDVGDELLKLVAQRLRSSLRESDTLARIGGDEFNLILANIDHAEYAATAAEKILNRLQTPFTIRGQELRISASIGISIFPDDSRDRTTLLKYADIAMYHAKGRGRNTYQFYNPEINVRSMERRRFEIDLHHTLARGELVVHYQPLFISRTRKVVAAEALVRWQHPEFGLLESGRFIPVAEETGFIKSIDTWVLKTACAQFRKWMDSGQDDLSVSVNLSGRMFQTADVVQTISGILAETGLPPRKLEIEITETVAMSDIERTSAHLKQLTAKGVGITIDDFGKGNSSLTYLRKLPITGLKIDQSFVKDIVTDADDRSIIKALTSMAHTMNMRVIAEGVETEEQLSFLSSIQCDESQGYVLSGSLPAEEFRQLVAPGK